MSIKPPPRWTARSLTAMFMPHLFRNPRHPQESTGVRKEKVPLDADQQQLYIKRKLAKLEKAICHDFKLNLEKPATTPKGRVWSVATGEWVPKHYLKLDTFFPYSLGPTVAREVSGRIQFRGSESGMLLPPAVWGPYNDWSLTIAPEMSCRHVQKPKSYVFRILESVEGKRKPLPLYPESRLTVKDLDRKPLHFKSEATLNPHSCYFQSCCAVWRLTYQEQPDSSAEDFWERFQYKMDGLWGNLKDRRKILDIFKPLELLKGGDVGVTTAKVEDVLPSTDDEPASEQTQWEQLEESRQTKQTTEQDPTFSNAQAL